MIIYKHISGNEWLISEQENEIACNQLSMTVWNISYRE
jgi:hypothetical protein